MVCSIDHPYHSLFTSDAEGHRTTVDPAYFQEVLDLDNGTGKYDGATVIALVKKWLTVRVKDMQFVLNTLKAQAQNPGSDEVYQRMDFAHIGLFGHSLGGATSAQIARDRDDIDAVIDLNGTLFGEYLDYVDGKRVVNTTMYPVPLLIIYTDAPGRSIDATNDPNGQNPVNRITAVDADATIEQMNRTILAFFNVYLKGEGSFSAVGTH